MRAPLIFAAAILATLLLGNARDPAWQRAVTAGAAAVAIWLAIRLELPPDAYIAGVLAAAALNFIDLSSFALDPMRLLLVALAGYGLALLALSWAKLERAHFYAAVAVVSVLTVHVLTSDAPIVGANRYYLRTALLTFTPVMGALGPVRRGRRWPPAARLAAAAAPAQSPQQRRRHPLRRRRHAGGDVRARARDGKVRRRLDQL